MSMSEFISSNVLEFFRSDSYVYQAAQMHIWLYYSSVHIAHLEEEEE